MVPQNQECSSRGDESRFTKPQMETEPSENKKASAKGSKQMLIKNLVPKTRHKEARCHQGGTGATKIKGTPWAVVPNGSSCKIKHIFLA